MRAPPVAAALAVATLVVACLGNKDPYNPGTPLGEYTVSGMLTTNGCGDALGAMNPWTFSVKLSEDANTLYWVQGSLPVSGTLDGSGHTTMSSTSTQDVHPADPKSGAGACSIARADALDLTLAKDTSAFSGTLGYTFAPTSGSDCTDQLATAGGPYATLPCTVTYALMATRSSSAP
jgi:hypothetical protein